MVLLPRFNEDYSYTPLRESREFYERRGGAESPFPLAVAIDADRYAAKQTSSPAARRGCRKEFLFSRAALLGCVVFNREAVAGASLGCQSDLHQAITCRPYRD